MLTFLIRHSLTPRGTSSRVCMPNLEEFGPIMKEEEWNTQDFVKVKLIYRFVKFHQALYGVPSLMEWVFIIILYENVFQNPEASQSFSQAIYFSVLSTRQWELNTMSFQSWELHAMSFRWWELHPDQTNWSGSDMYLIWIFERYLIGEYGGFYSEFDSEFDRTRIKKFDRILTSNPINKISNVWSGCSVLSIMRTVESSWVN
jgi:hypothetical protein